MAKDYFQDITPPSDDSFARRTPPKSGAAPSAAPTPVHLDEPEEESSIPIRVDNGTTPPRGIRSIPATRAGRPSTGDMREVPAMPGIMGTPPRAGGRSSRFWIWGAAVVAVIVVAGLLLFAFRATTVTVVPRSHTITLTDANSYIAYPATTAASGTLAYTLKTVDLEDSQVVPVSGTTTSVASKASGSVTVYNSYSTAPVHLIKTTRFQTPDGLIFRVPADVTIPGKSGSTPGSVQVTIVADATGNQYNVAPARFTVPGLKSNAPMYAGVYAKSTAAMTGGSSGTSGPGVDPTALSAAVSTLQASLLSKANDAAAAQAVSGQMVLKDLIQITYATQPNTAEAGGGARVHETAHVEIPVFNATDLGEMVGSAVSADSDNSPATITPGAGFAVHVSGSPADLSQGPLQFTLAGQAALIWSVDTNALAAALAGRDQGAFQTVIAGFSGIQEAHAKIEPFWKSTFPSNASAIKVVVTSPAVSQ